MGRPAKALRVSSEEGRTHGSGRTLTEATGLPKTTVHRYLSLCTRIFKLSNDPFFIDLDGLQDQLLSRGFTRIDVAEQGDAFEAMPFENLGGDKENDAAPANPQSLDFSSLDAYRPIVERAPDPQIAEAQRR